jgi:hypothetical protein
MLLGVMHIVINVFQHCEYPQKFPEDGTKNAVNFKVQSSSYKLRATRLVK